MPNPNSSQLMFAGAVPLLVTPLPLVLAALQEEKASMSADRKLCHYGWAILLMIGEATSGRSEGLPLLLPCHSSTCSKKLA